MSFTWDVNAVSCIPCHCCPAERNQVRKKHKHGCIATVTYSHYIIRCNPPLIYYNVPFVVNLYVKPYFYVSASRLLDFYVILSLYLSTSIATI